MLDSRNLWIPSWILCSWHSLAKSCHPLILLRRHRKASRGKALSHDAHEETIHGEWREMRWGQLSSHGGVLAKEWARLTSNVSGRHTESSHGFIWVDARRVVCQNAVQQGWHVEAPQRHVLHLSWQTQATWFQNLEFLGSGWWSKLHFSLQLKEQHAPPRLLVVRQWIAIWNAMRWGNSHRKLQIQFLASTGGTKSSPPTIPTQKQNWDSAGPWC